MRKVCATTKAKRNLKSPTRSGRYRVIGDGKFKDARLKKKQAAATNSKANARQRLPGPALRGRPLQSQRQQKNQQKEHRQDCLCYPSVCLLLLRRA
jgi:hypothetical protein